MSGALHPFALWSRNFGPIPHPRPHKPQGKVQGGVGVGHKHEIPKGPNVNSKIYCKYGYLTISMVISAQLTISISQMSCGDRNEMVKGSRHISFSMRI